VTTRNPLAGLANSSGDVHRCTADASIVVTQLRDFGKDSGSELRAALISELEAIGADKRVRWIRTLADLVLTLAAEHSSEEPGNLKEIQARLHEETLRAFVNSEVLGVTAGTALDAQRCGLSLPHQQRSSQ
jgi:hypothetical protein